MINVTSLVIEMKHLYKPLKSHKMWEPARRYPMSYIDAAKFELHCRYTTRFTLRSKWTLRRVQTITGDRASPDCMPSESLQLGIPLYPLRYEHYVAYAFWDLIQDYSSCIWQSGCLWLVDNQVNLVLSSRTAQGCLAMGANDVGGQELSVEVVKLVRS